MRVDFSPPGKGGFTHKKSRDFSSKAGSRSQGSQGARTMTKVALFANKNDPLFCLMRLLHAPIILL